MTIYPAIDIKDGKCVRLAQGDFGKVTIYEQNVAAVAKRWQDAGAEYIHVVDLDGSRKGCAYNNDAIQAILSAVSIPVQVGGGIRCMEDVKQKLAMGVTRVILGTSAVNDKDFVKKAIELYGKSIAIGIDAKDGKAAIEAWEQTSGENAVDLALEMKSFGAETIIYTNIAKDGMLTGPDFESTAEMISVTGMNIIASGGVSGIEDLKKLREIGSAGVIVGKALYVGAIDLKDALNI